MSKWKSFNDELPPEGEWVLICTKSGYFEIACLRGDKMINDTFEVTNGTHWIYLPEGPNDNGIGE